MGTNKNNYQNLSWRDVIDTSSVFDMVLPDCVLHGLETSPKALIEFELDNLEKTGVGQELFHKLQEKYPEKKVELIVAGEGRFSNIAVGKMGSNALIGDEAKVIIDLAQVKTMRAPLMVIIAHELSHNVDNNFSVKKDGLSIDSEYAKKINQTIEQHTKLLLNCEDPCVADYMKAKIAYNNELGKHLEAIDKMLVEDLSVINVENIKLIKERNEQLPENEKLSDEEVEFMDKMIQSSIRTLTNESFHKLNNTIKLDYYQTVCTNSSLNTRSQNSTTYNFQAYTDDISPSISETKSDKEILMDTLEKMDVSNASNFKELLQADYIARSRTEDVVAYLLEKKDYNLLESVMITNNFSNVSNKSELSPGLINYREDYSMDIENSVLAAYGHSKSRKTYTDVSINLRNEEAVVVPTSENFTSKKARNTKPDFNNMKSNSASAIIKDFAEENLSPYVRATRSGQNAYNKVFDNDSDIVVSHIERLEEIFKDKVVTKYEKQELKEIGKELENIGVKADMDFSGKETHFRIPDFYLAADFKVDNGRGGK